MMRTLFAPTSTGPVVVVRQRALGGYAWQTKSQVHAIAMAKANPTARRLRRLPT